MPVAPDFQDPASVPNYPPYFVDSDPFAETTGIRPPQKFIVHVRDPNPGDLLYVRWAADYPPFTEADSRLLVTPALMMGGTPQTSTTTTITYDLGGMASPSACRELTAGTEHKLVVIVADRPFVSTDSFNNSPFRYNLLATQNSSTVPIMQGWSVTCP